MALGDSYVIKVFLLGRGWMGNEFVYSKLKGQGFGCFEKGIACIQVFVSQISEIGQPIL